MIHSLYQLHKSGEIFSQVLFVLKSLSKQVQIWEPRLKTNNFLIFFYFFCGSVAQRWPWPPHSWSFSITHSDASQLVGLLWSRDQCVAGTSTWQHTTLTTDRHPRLRWDRTHHLSRRSAVDLRLKPRSQWDWQFSTVGFIKLKE